MRLPHLHPLAGRRLISYGLDCAGYLGLAVATVPAGLLLRRRRVLSERDLLVVSAMLPLAATGWAARAESGTASATLGKRRCHLVVRDHRTGCPPSTGAALLRNTVKIFVPWQLGHISTITGITGITGGFDRNRPLTLVTTVATYGLIAATLASVALGDGRALHDRIAGTVVAATEAATPRR
jgi:uncharacterized RDD family membrane protein YckC